MNQEIPPIQRSPAVDQNGVISLSSDCLKFEYQGQSWEMDILESLDIIDSHRKALVGNPEVTQKEFLLRIGEVVVQSGGPEGLPLDVLDKINFQLELAQLKKKEQQNATFAAIARSLSSMESTLSG